jgi:MFS family permease
MFVPLVLVVMNIAYAASAYPAGAWSDRAGRRVVLLAGVGVLVLADVRRIPVGMAHGAYAGLAGDQVTDTVPANLRGTAFGAFNLVSGVAMLSASVLAGLLWDRFAAPGTFAAGAVFSLISLVGLAFVGRR